jgi:hypothetical protein
LSTVHRFAPLTVMMMGLTTASAVATGAISGHTGAATVDRWGPSLDALARGRFWTLATGDWLVYNQRHWLSMLLLFLLFALPLEILAGRMMLAMAFWLGSWGGTVVTAVLVRLLAGHLGWHPHPDLVMEPDIGGSAGTWGAAGALHVVLTQRPSWLVWPLRLGSFLYLGERLVLVHGSADVAHVVAVGIGSAVAWGVSHWRAQNGHRAACGG